MTKHALIIDDDVMSLEVLSQLLEIEGFTFTTVQDPKRLSEILNTLKQVDIVFLDLEMPAIDGYAVFKYLKNDVGLTAPIVAHTVHTSESNHVLSLGFDAFICKPLNSDDFHDQLLKILDGQRVWITSNR